MKRTKYLMMIFLMAVCIMIIPSLVNAAETFTTSDGIVATKSLGSNDGSLNFKLTNIPLINGGQYEWGVATTNSSSAVEKWNTLGDFSEKNKTANIVLAPSDNAMLKILKENNAVFLYIKDVSNDKLIVNALNVDLTLPVVNLKTMKTSYSGTWYIRVYKKYKIDNMYYQFEKITDQKAIDAYNEAIINNSNLNEVTSLKKVEDAPEDNWKEIDDNLASYVYDYRDIEKSNWPTEDGLYYLWIKAKDTDSKTVIGYTIWDVDSNGPSVLSIKVDSPSSGTYKTGQTVKIHVNFSETITGTTVPTLKIRFGESAERSVTNGTIKSNYIEYSYNIQDGDIGQIATVDLSGGTITDAKGNAAKLSCPIISGSTIKANVDGTITNQTDNQDKNNNNQTEKPSTNNNTTNTPSTNKNNTTNTPSTNKNNTTNTPSANKNNTTNTPNSGKTSNKNDVTTSNIKLPNTGVGVGIIIIIALGLIIAGFSYFKFKGLKNIK